MTVIKTPSGRYCAKLKSGRQFVTSKTFDTKREAVAWLARERAALAGGIDPRAGRERVRHAMTRWLEVRRTTVARKTYRADQDLTRLSPTGLLALQVSAVSGREVARAFDTLLASGLAEASVVRYRASLSSFFAWCVREKLIATNPVTGVTVPKLGRADRDQAFHGGRARGRLPRVETAERAPGRHSARARLDRVALGGGSIHDSRRRDGDSQPGAPGAAVGP